MLLARGIGGRPTKGGESAAATELGGRRPWGVELGFAGRRKDEAAASSWRIRASGGRARHGCQGWPARVPRLAGGRTTRAVRRRTEQGGERDRGG